MSEAPSFSVVVPTFQRREVVCDCVRALAATIYDGAIDLTLVVDGSTDGTAEALAALALPFPMRVIEQSNSGAASARNRGAADANGEILLFLDDDMMAAPDMVAQHARSHENGADAVLGHIPLDPGSPPSFLTAAYARWADDRAERLAAGAPLTLFDLLTGQLSVKRQSFEQLGGFDEAFTAGGCFGDEDLDFGIRLLERGRVEFNRQAISRQRYVVSPRQYLAQWSDAGRADALFARKHPASAKELYELHGGGRAFHRLLLGPLASISGAPAALSAGALWLAERHEHLPRPLKGAAAKLFSAARDLVYWAAVREGETSLGRK